MTHTLQTSVGARLKRFKGRSAIVTGASRGIGLAVARRILDEDGVVMITGRDEAALRVASLRLNAPGRVLTVAGSAEDEEHQHAAIEQALAQFGHIDVLVNNTGINPIPMGDVISAPPGKFLKTFEVNVLSGLSWAAKARAAGMAKGSIVNVSSIAGLRPASGIGAYGATKAALIHVTQQLAREMSPFVRVNAVAPAVVRTQFAGPLYADRETEVAAGYPMGRLGVPEDVAGAVAFLASDDASWITGQILTIDGGLTLQGGV